MMTRRELLLRALAGAALTEAAPVFPMQRVAGTILIDRSILRFPLVRRHPGIIMLGGPIIDDRLVAMLRGRAVVAWLAPASHVLLIELLRDQSVTRLVQRVPRASDLDATGIARADVLPTARLVEFQIA